MKTKIFGLTLAALLVSAAMPASAQSVGNGRVNFTGELIDETCLVMPGSEDQLVELPTVSTQSLAVAGDTAGSKAFDIAVNNCPTALSQVAAHFEITNMEAANRTLKNLAVADAADKVTVQLLNADGTVIKAGNAGEFFDITGTGTDRGAVMTYGGQYYALGATTAGKVETFAEFTLAYP